MQVFVHHLYEYKRGLRNLILHTTDAMFEDIIKARLEDNNIAYIIEKINSKKINVFFGNPICIEVLKYLNTKDLSSLSDEEDFILGIMLGYDRIKQCERYVKRKKMNLSFKRQQLVG